MTANHTSHGAADDAEMLTMLTDSVVDFCARALPRTRLRAQREQVPPFSRDAFAEMAELGWLGLVVSEADGGLGLGVDAVVRVCRELGKVLAVEPYVESALAALLLLAASPAARGARDAVIGGACVATVPLTPAAWHDAAAAVRAEAGSDGFRLHGVLPQFPLAPDADLLLVPAAVNGEALLFAVPRESAGVMIESLALADGSRDGRVTLTATPCGPDTVLLRGAALAAARDHALAVAGIGASAYLHGASEALFDVTLEYLRTRKQFGRAIGSFQALQHRAVDLYAALRLTTAALNAAIDTARDGGNLVLAAARARRRAIATAQTMIREGIQLHGAIGYTDEYDVSLFVHRVLTLSARWGGAEQELFAVPAIARGELGAHDADLPAAERLPLDYRPADGDWNALDDAAFRDLVRRWIETNYPEDLRHPPAYVRWAAIRDWHLKLVERGWGAPAWPREFGGMGLDAAKMIVFIEELERFGVARAPDQGIVTVAPILFEYGNDDQRARFLNHTLRGDHIWCQGYSEPNAGSDLASLATSAVLDGDEFIVNGQKTWTTHGVDATHMYCLVRTDKDVKPQAGISFLLIDLDQPGVTVRPIHTLGGHTDFCEVFLDDVRVPTANLVGGLNQGWTIAKSLLGHERLFVGSPKLCQHALHQLRDLASATGQYDDPVFMAELTRITLDVADLEALYAEYAAIVKAGGTPGADVAILKIWSTETYVRLSEMILRAAGTAGGTRGRLAFGEHRIDVLSSFYNARPAPIYAGSNEIQRNILAKAVLGLPS